MEFHTYLNILLKPIIDEIANLNWFISDLDFMTGDIDGIPINFSQEYFFLSNTEFKDLLNSNTQIIWGVISAIPENINVNIDESNLPFAEDNDLVWKNDNFQIEESVIEIIAYDSSYTIIKFKNLELSNKFKTYFDEAIELEKFS